MLGGMYGELNCLPPPMRVPPQHPPQMFGQAAPRCRGRPSTSHSLLPKPTQPKPTPPPAANKPTADENRNPNPIVTEFQPALVGVTSSVHDEYDPARPNDYEDCRRERSENWRRRGENRRVREKEGQGLGFREAGIQPEMLLDNVNLRPFDVGIQELLILGFQIWRLR